MFKVILSALVTLGMSSVAFAQAGGAPAGGAPAGDTPVVDAPPAHMPPGKGKHPMGDKHHDMKAKGANKANAKKKAGAEHKDKEGADGHDSH